MDGGLLQGVVWRNWCGFSATFFGPFKYTDGSYGRPNGLDCNLGVESKNLVKLNFANFRYKFLKSEISIF